MIADLGSGMNYNKKGSKGPQMIGLVEFLTMDKAMAKRAHRESASIPVKIC